MDEAKQASQEMTLEQILQLAATASQAGIPVDWQILCMQLYRGTVQQLEDVQQTQESLRRMEQEFAASTAVIEKQRKVIAKLKPPRKKRVTRKKANSGVITGGTG